MEYVNWKLSRINLENGYGYVSMPDGQFHFYTKDHLGNNRMVVNQNGTIEQVNHYYPYGINLYDYSARYMDPALGRFTTMDPLVERYYSTSPYAYAWGTPWEITDQVHNENVNGTTPECFSTASQSPGDRKYYCSWDRI